MDNKKQKDKAKITHLWGDQEPCFYYAYRLAQEEMMQRSHASNTAFLKLA